MLLIGGLPTSAALLPPLPFSPWQCWHFCAKIVAPCAEAPLPRGRFLPSGCTLMFHAESSAGVTGVPSPGPAAMAGEEMSASATSLDVNMAHAPVRIDRPARRPVVVLADE